MICGSLTVFLWRWAKINLSMGAVNEGSAKMCFSYSLDSDQCYNMLYSCGSFFLAAKVDL